MKTKEEMYAMQKEKMKGSIFSTPFVPKDFRCYICQKDLLTNAVTLKEAEEGILITGCRHCHRSFCD